MQLAALAIVVLLAFRLRALWEQNPVDLSMANLPLLVTAATLSFAAVVAYGVVWPHILAVLGVARPSGALGLFLKSQLGRYLPGNVWHYAGRVGLARARGVPVRATIVSIGVEVGASVLAAILVGLFVLPLALAAPLAVVLLLVVRLARSRWITTRVRDPFQRLVRGVAPVPGDDVRAALRAIPEIVGLYVPVWLLYGLAFWLTARALFPVPAGDVVFYAAAFALGWLAGMVVVFAPGGIGVREAVLVALLAPRVGEAEAIVIAATSRIMLTMADLVGGTGALTWDRIAARRDRVRDG